MKKVLMIGLTPPDEGGSQVHIGKIIKYLDKNKYCIKILTQKGSSLQSKIEVPYPKTKNTYFNSFIFLIFCLFKIWFNKQYDIIHVHESFFFPFLKHFKKKCDKLIITVHGMRGFKFYDNKKFWPKFKKGLKNADAFIVVSLDTKGILEKEDFKKIYYIPNGVDFGIYPQSSKILNQFCFIGRLHEQKGVVYLIRAFKKVVKKYPDFKLKLIGTKEGNYYKDLLKLIEEENIPHINFLGYIPNEFQRAKILSESYSNILPSLWEGLPLTLFECLASKRPLIVSNLEQIKPVVKNNALLIPPKDVEGLIKNMFFLIKNPKNAKELGLKGYNLSKNYSWKNITKKTEEIYEK